MGSKRKTAGERIARSVYPMGIDGMEDHVQPLASRIDAAINRALREAYAAGMFDGGKLTNEFMRLVRDPNATFTAELSGSKKIEKKYGVKL